MVGDSGRAFLFLHKHQFPLSHNRFQRIRRRVWRNRQPPRRGIVIGATHKNGARKSKGPVPEQKSRSIERPFYSSKNCFRLANITSNVDGGLSAVNVIEFLASSYFVDPI